MSVLKGGNKQGIDDGFAYFQKGDIYVDSACQTPRPTPVMKAMRQYYETYNTCGGRVKYEWGQRVDDEVAQARSKVLKLLGKSSKEYTCAFTLNTTYGINQVLSQIPTNKYSQVITSDIEHNSVFLPTMVLANRIGVKRSIFERAQDGSLIYQSSQLDKAIVVLNSSSNIDGRNLLNANQLAKDVHDRGGLLLIDGAQTMAHSRSVLAGVNYDALCFSGHKMYGPSLGIIVIKNDLINNLDVKTIGGGMVQSVSADGYKLIEGDLATRLEAGLQDFAGIIGLSAAIDWLNSYKIDGKTSLERIGDLSSYLFNKMHDVQTLEVINDSPSPVFSFYSDKIDSHKLAIYLSAQGIMARSGYFCCHYYLIEKRRYPPLLRISLGLQNSEEHIDKIYQTLIKILERV
jgi:cysteine desulfurase/selenocysteine lyase